MQGEKISRQAWGAVEWLLQSRAATVRGAGMAGTVSGGAPRAPRRSIYGSRQQAPTARRGPERLCGGLPVGRAAGARLCNRPSAGQGLRQKGGRPSAADRSELVSAGSSEGTRIEIKRPGARLWAVGVCAIASVAVALKAHRRSAEGPALVPLGGGWRTSTRVTARTITSYRSVRKYSN
jgi:hypothetical protein